MVSVLRLLLLGVAMVAPTLGVAQGIGDMVSYSDLERAASGPPEDAAITLFSGILGEFGRNPWLAVGTSTSLIGDVFFVFNSVVFVLGTVWLVWLVLAAVAASAHDGEVLPGASALWAPIRLGVGVFGLLPAFGGFSLFQAIFMQAVVLGIGAGNLVTHQILGSTQAFKAVTPAYSSAASAPNLSSDVRAMTRGLIFSELCYFSQLERWDAAAMRGVPQRDHFAYADRSGLEYGVCGRAEVRARSSEAPRGGDSLVAYRLNAVNYDGIAVAVQSAARAELKTLQGEAQKLVATYVAAFKAGDASAIGNAVAAVEDLERATRARLNNAIQAAVKSDSGAIEQGVFESMRAGGWMKLGSYYQVFSETSAALADAQRAFEWRYSPGPVIENAGKKVSAVSSELWSLALILNAETKADTSDDAGFLGQIADRVLPAKNELGHRSVGQTIAGMMTDQVAENSGGAGLVNPVTAAKNLGDWMMTVGQAGIAASAGLDFLGGLGKGLKVASALIPSVSQLGELTKIILYVFIGLGMFLAIFVPMLVWTTWLSAILVYLVSMFEGLIFSQIAAFSHLRMGGQAFMEAGSPGVKFYQYLTSALFRPALMVLGFLLASATMTFMGTFVLEGFAVAMAASQGNSMTGLLSIVAYLILFCVILFGLVQSCANLMIDLPDRLLGWLGGHAESNKGPILGAAAGAAIRGMKGPAGTGGSAIAPKASEIAPSTAK